MKLRLYRIGFLLGVLVLAACSQSRPSTTILLEAINKTLPAHLAAQGKNYQYSPIKEVLGTTLPAGSYQVDVQTTVKAKEPLYALKTFARFVRQAPLPKEFQVEMDKLEEMVDWSREGSLAPDPRGANSVRPQLSGFLVPVVKANEEKTCWVKVIAEPRGSEWLITMVEGEPHALFSSYQPRSAFDSELLIYGSEEQRRNLSAVEAAYKESKRNDEIFRKLAPEIKQLQESEFELSQRYEKEINLVLEKVIVASRAAGAEHDRRVHELIAAGGAAHDNYKTRDRLIDEESARDSIERQAFNDRIKKLEEQRSVVRSRAHAEIEEKVKTLIHQHGLDG